MMDDIVLEIQMNLVINRLATISASIENIYKHLARLEIEGKKDTDEYLKYLDYLSIAKEAEEELYEKYNFTEDEYNELIKKIIDTRMSGSLSNDYESIISDNLDDINLRRVVNILTYKMEINKKQREHFDEFNEYQELFLKYLDDSFYKIGIICNQLLIDIINGFLLFIDEAIDDDNNKDIRDALIKTKYNICMIFRENESLLIDNHFKSPNKLGNYTKMMAYCLGMSKVEVNHITRERMNKLIIRQIYKMINAKKDDQSSVIRACLIRGCLLLIGDSLLYDITEYYSKLEKGKNQKADKMLQMCFYKINEDREKQISITL